MTTMIDLATDSKKTIKSIKLLVTWVVEALWHEAHVDHAQLAEVELRTPVFVANNALGLVVALEKPL